MNPINLFSQNKRLNCVIATKGQVSVEYIVSLILFIVFMSFFFVQLLNQQPIYMRELRTETIRSEAYQISELLINDAGYPINWNLDPDNAQRVGFSSNLNKTNLLSMNKINAIGVNCKDIWYNNLKNKIGAEDDFSLFIYQQPGNTPLLACYPTQIILRDINITFKRPVAFDDGNYGELVLQMW